MVGGKTQKQGEECDYKTMGTAELGIGNDSLEL